MANERRLIDKTPLIHAIGDYMATNAYLNDTALDVLKLIARWVDDAPTVDAVEVVEVVRCKNCKCYFHYGKTSLVVDGKNVKAGWCQRRMRHDEETRMLPNDFCSYGEKREVE